MILRKRRRVMIVVLVGAVLTGSTLGAIALRQRSAEPVAIALPARSATLTVELVQPKPMQWPDYVRANGDIAAWQEAVVSAEVAGLRLAEVLVDVGDQVERGQVLARFDAATTQASVNQFEAAVTEAKAMREEAESLATRAEQLRRSNAISEQDLIQARTRAHAAAAQVRSAEARLHAQRLVLQYTEVTAPDDGVISARTAMLGSVTNAGAELFRLVRQNRLEWRADLTGAQLARVHVGLPASVSLPDGSTVTGRVRQLSPVLNSATRTGIAYVELDAKSTSHARAGMYASGAIELGLSDGLELPASAVIQRDGHDYVFMMGADSEVVLVKIEVGRRRGSAVEIVSGLTTADRCVLSGGAFLNDGDRVRIAGSSQETP